jgi:hypothetical protein
MIGESIGALTARWWVFNVRRTWAVDESKPGDRMSSPISCIFSAEQFYQEAVYRSGQGSTWPGNVRPLSGHLRTSSA